MMTLIMITTTVTGCVSSFHYIRCISTGYKLEYVLVLLDLEAVPLT